MMRTLVGFVLSAIGLWFAERAARCLPPSGAPRNFVKSPFETPPATLVPDDGRERYVHELASLKHAKCDGVLAYVLGSPVWFDGYSFTKVADLTWRQ